MFVFGNNAKSKVFLDSVGLEKKNNEVTDYMKILFNLRAYYLTASAFIFNTINTIIWINRSLQIPHSIQYDQRSPLQSNYAQNLTLYDHLSEMVGNSAASYGAIVYTTADAVNTTALSSSAIIPLALNKLSTHNKTRNTLLSIYFYWTSYTGMIT